MPTLLVVLRLQYLLLTTSLRARRSRKDDGASTLEMVIIALGLMAMAGLLIAALTTAVTSRTSKIK